MSTEIKAFERPPHCKPLRFLELMVITASFFLLFFLRQFNPEDEIICSPTVLIILFTTVGSTFLIALIDVVTQGCREPVPNSPMIFSLLLCFVMCLTTSITALIVHSRYGNYKSQRNLNTLCLLAGTCFLASLMYIIDSLIVIRYSCE